MSAYCVSAVLVTRTRRWTTDTVTALPPGNDHVPACPPPCAAPQPCGHCETHLMGLLNTSFHTCWVSGLGRAGTRAVKLPSAVGCAAALTQLESWKAQPCFLSGFSPRWRFLYRHLTQNMLLSVGIGPRELVAASQTLGIPASLSGPTEQRLEGQWAMCTVLRERVVANGPPSPAKCTQCPVRSEVTVHAHWGRMSPTCLIYHHNDCNQIISRLHRWMEEQVYKWIWKQQSLFVQKFGRNVDFNVGMDLF